MTQVTPRTFGRNQVTGTVSFTRTENDSITLLGFEDTSRNSTINTDTVWSRRFSQFLTFRFRYQFTRTTSETTPFFANRVNVSGDAGITGNNQDPVNWGPPTIWRSRQRHGAAVRRQLRDSRHADARHGRRGASGSRGRHNFQFGGDAPARSSDDIRSQQNPRGQFTFTGYATGYDFADFLLGLPHTSSIAFGNADKELPRLVVRRASSPTTGACRAGAHAATLGVRWEYESPITEAQGRLVNLDVAPGFTAAAPGRRRAIRVAR